MNKNVLVKTKDMDGFLNLMIGSLDSRPVFATVGGFKKGGFQKAFAELGITAKITVTTDPLEGKYKRESSKPQPPVPE